MGMKQGPEETLACYNEPSTTMPKFLSVSNASFLPEHRPSSFNTISVHVLDPVSTPRDPNYGSSRVANDLVFAMAANFVTRPDLF